jgi:hypothetical protein
MRPSLLFPDPSAQTTQTLRSGDFDGHIGQTVATLKPIRTGRFRAVAILMTGILLAQLSGRAAACPFCSAVSETIRQQSISMDAVVIASSLDSELTKNQSTGVVKMKIETVLKGEALVKVGQTVDVVYYGKAEVGRRFLLSGVDPPNLQWSPMPVTPKAEEYIVKASKVQGDEAARLLFFSDYLEDEESLIARDAFDEFASAPYDVIKKIGPQMDHDQLIQWVKQPEIGADRKRLYFTMLGVCGSKADLPMLEALLRNPAKSGTIGLDALIACYLTLAGESGLPLIDELFISDNKTPFANNYAAIMALRFHGTEGDVIPRSALVESLHKILERPELADMVIPDLAKWKDWSQIDRLKRLFKESDKDNEWVRVPVVNYLRACPLPEAEKAIEELEKIDPEAVRRAKTFFPIPVPTRSKPSDDTTSASEPVLQGLLSGTRLAAVTPRAPMTPLAASGQGRAAEPPRQTILATTAMNPWDLGYVITLALASVVLLLFLVLTGGPASGTIAVAGSND